MNSPSAIHNPDGARSYELLQKYTGGIELFGHEVKAIKSGRGSLRGAYVTYKKGEIFLIDFLIPPYQAANVPEYYAEKRPRRLLLTKREIRHLAQKMQQERLTVIPLKVFSSKGLIKVEIALAKGLKKYEKREKIKKRDFDREKERAIKRTT
ncbi:MAG: SsrA-binding protein [Parcubacteria group bacterium GW2011_GWC1_41_7]|nr:MAG: SsrA-binding protein [Parcubacteria group bacterium GW2011_GWC1_41_7]